MSIDQIQEEIVEEFSIFDDWMDRYQQLIDLGGELPPIDEQHRTEENLIKGCQSRVWVSAQLVDGKIVFEADSDAIITKGIVALLLRVLNHRTPREIIDSDLNFIDRIGLKENLSPTRSNGLLAMIKQMKMYAIAFNAKG